MAKNQLIQALAVYDTKQCKDDMALLLVSKVFEVAIEYAWRDLKYRVEDEGLVQ